MPFYTEQDRNFVQALKTKGYSKDDALAELDKQKARTAPTVPAVSDIASSISGMAEKGLVAAHDSTPHELGVMAMGAQEDLAKREQMKTDIALVNNVSGPKDNPNYFGQVANAYNQGNETIDQQSKVMSEQTPFNPLNPIATAGAKAFNLVNAPLAPIFSALQKNYEDASKGLMSNEDKQSLKEYQDKGLKGIEILMQAEVDGTQDPALKVAKQAELDKYIAGTRALETNPNYQMASLAAKGAGGVAMATPFVEGLGKPVDLTRPIGEVPTSYKGTPPGGTPMTIEELAAHPDFNAKLNKALPPTKNDVRDVGARSNAAATVITDIAKNKDTLGLVDEAGNPRLPSGKNVFQETVQAQDARTADLYKSYTEKLTGVDKAKFSDDITSAVADQTKTMEDQLARENSAGTRAALERKITELKTLRDTSPKGIQDYVQTLNRETKTAPGAPLTPDQVQSANLAGSMRKVLDESVGKIEGPGYQQERNIYGAHRQMQDAFLRAAAKEIRNTPGLTEKLANMGLTVEGINYLLTHNPSSLVTGLGFKAAVEFVKRINSPGAAMEGLFKMADQGLVNAEIPQATIPTATNISNTPI